MDRWPTALLFKLVTTGPAGRTWNRTSRFPAMPHLQPHAPLPSAKEGGNSVPVEPPHFRKRLAPVLAMMANSTATMFQVLAYFLF